MKDLVLKPFARAWIASKQWSPLSFFSQPDVFPSDILGSTKGGNSQSLSHSEETATVSLLTSLSVLTTPITKPRCMLINIDTPPLTFETPLFEGE